MEKPGALGVGSQKKKKLMKTNEPGRVAEFLPAQPGQDLFDQLFSVPANNVLCPIQSIKQPLDFLRSHDEVLVQFGVNALIHTLL